MKTLLYGKPVIFSEEDIKPYIPQLEEYYLKSPEQIDMAEITKMIHIAEALSLKYINTYVQEKKGYEIFSPTLFDDNFDGMFLSEGLITYNTKHMDAKLIEGDFLYVLSVFLHESTHLIQYDEEYFLNFANGATVEAEIPLHLATAYNIAINDYVIPYLNKQKVKKGNAEVHKLFLDKIFEDKRLDTLFSKFYFLYMTPILRTNEDPELMPSNISYRNSFFEREANTAAFDLEHQLADIILKGMTNKKAKSNLLRSLNISDKYSHLTYENKISRNHYDYYNDITRLDPKNFYGLIQKLENTEFACIVPYIMAIYYSCDSDSKLDKFENLAKNDKLAMFVAADLNEDQTEFFERLEEAVEEENYNILSTKNAIYGLNFMNKPEIIKPAIQIYLKNLDLNAFFTFYENDELNEISELFSEENCAKYADMFFEQFISVLSEIDKTDNVEKYIVNMSKIKDNAFSLMWAWLDKSGEERDKIVKKMVKHQERIAEKNDKYFSKPIMAEWGEEE